VQPIFHRKYNQLKPTTRTFRMHDARGRSVEQLAEDFRTVYNDAWVDHENHKPMEAAAATEDREGHEAGDGPAADDLHPQGYPMAMYISLPELNEIFRT
jgi:hypothetical protein